MPAISLFSKLGVVTNAANSLPELAGGVTPLLAGHFGASHAFISRIGSKEMQCLGSITALSGFAETEYNSRHRAQDDVLFSRMRSTKPVIRTGTQIDVSRFMRSETYERAYHANNLAFPMIAKLSASTSDEQTWVILFRDLGDRDFKAEEEEEWEQLVPMIDTAWHRVERAEQSERAARALNDLLVDTDSRPILLFGENGDLLWASPSAVMALGRDLPRRWSEEWQRSVNGPLRRVELRRCSKVPLGATLIQPEAEKMSVVVIDSLQYGSPRVLALAVRAKLTPSETETLAGLDMGMSTSRIAACKGVSVHTVRTHIKRLMRKLGAHSRSELQEILESG